jgi:glucose/arabinose dehydrogenase
VRGLSNRGWRIPPAVLVALAAACTRGAESEPAIVTEAFEPKPVTIALDRLPPPNATASERKFPQMVPAPDPPRLKAPAGFHVTRWYGGALEKPRWLALTPEGDVLVTETKKNRILRLRDADGDGTADEATTFADEGNGLNIPFGMAFSATHVYVGNTNAVRRWPYSKGQSRRLDGTGELVTELTGGGYRQHWTRNVRVSPDGGHLFVTVGSAGNNDEEPAPRASVLRMKLDGSERETFANGLRNPVGLDFEPTTGEVYVTVNERDGLGDDLVPDYMTRVRAGEFFGWPWAYLSKTLLDPKFVKDGASTNPDMVARTTTPDVLFQAHSAALGLAFYRGDAFPPKYRRGAFVAFRGSWNRGLGTGYQIVFVPFGADGRPLGGYEPFVTGFLVDAHRPATWGRPVGVLELPDGSLLFTEEENQRLYRVAYRP